jgi:aminoglycoside phosphotransferase (APT) family kinase protein
VTAPARPLAADDVVATPEEAARCERPPLVVVEPLRAYLDACGIGCGDLELTQIGDGRSNVIFLVSRDGAEVVLRRPPRPPMPPSAHDVVREARIVSALSATAVRTPAVLAVCDDAAVIGAPFFLMEKVEGFVISGEIPAPFDADVERRRIGDELIDALVEIHAADWRAAELESIARPGGYLERQLRRFSQLWEHNKTRELSAVTRVQGWLERHLPESPAHTVVHGDYRLGNVMFASQAPASLTAIFDWEMATIGDPLADIGYLCTLWVEPDDPPLGMYELSAVTRAPGFAARGELIERYGQRSGRRVGDIRWYQVLALWKSAVFMEGNYRRALAGATDDPFLRGFGAGVVELAERAEELTA